MDIEGGLRPVGYGKPHDPTDLRNAATLNLEQHSITSKLKIDKFLWLRKVFLLALIFSVSLSMVVVALFMSLPKVSTDGSANQWEGHTDLDPGKLQGEQELLLKLPRNIEELRLVRDTLEHYQEQHQRRVQLGIVCLYLFLQAFMLPGSIFLNILAGSFYGFYEALLLVTLLASAGSSLCYVLSRYILKDIVYYYYPERCEWLAKEVHCHRHSLLNYVLFLRITPLLPNWFINVASPLVSVPFREFFIGTFIGVIPASVVAVKAGRILSQLNSLNDLYDAHTLAALFFLAFLVILPVLLKRRLRQDVSGGKAT